MEKEGLGTGQGFGGGGCEKRGERSGVCEEVGRGPTLG